MVTHAGSAAESIAVEADRARTPWWYRYVKSWRWRMWLETGVWIPTPYVPADASVIPLRVAADSESSTMVQEAA